MILGRNRRAGWFWFKMGKKRFNFFKFDYLLTLITGSSKVLKFKFLGFYCPIIVDLITRKRLCAICVHCFFCGIYFIVGRVMSYK